MLYWKYFLLGALFAGAIAIVIYLTNEEKKEEKISKLKSKRLEKLLEQTTLKIGERQLELNRVLTEEEKNDILDECYSLVK